MKYKKSYLILKILEHYLQYQDFVEWFSYLEEKKIKNILEFCYQNLFFLKSADLKIGDSRILTNKDAIIKLVIHYIVNEKNHKGLPINEVSRFHLGNGAIVHDIIINANISETGLTKYLSKFQIKVSGGKTIRKER